jgi:guanylate kinase
LDALRTRLIGRGTDDPEEVERRLRVAAEELEAQPEFAHVVINDRLQDALEQLTAVVADELSWRGTTLEDQPGKATQP